MDIKKISNEKKPFDIHEWNDEIKAFVKPLNSFERLVFNYFFLTFYNKNNDPETRFDAGFRAALLVLVDENDNPLFTESDRDAVFSGSFIPFSRLFNQFIEIDEGKELDSIKKN